MIVVNVRVETDSGNMDALKTGIGAMESASRAEPGCRDYTFSVEVNDTSALRITEKWDSMEALVAHFQSTHMADFQKLIAASPPKNMETNFYEAEAVTTPGR